MMRLFNMLLPIFLLLSLNEAIAQLNNSSDTVVTENGQITIQPIVHGTLVLEWDDKTIYVDPYGGGELFEGIADPDIIFITHPHGDHLDVETLEAINTSNARFIVPQSVADEMPERYAVQVEVMENGEEIERLGIQISAIAMYNLPEKDSRHPKGWGNGYVLTMENKKIYLSGDTEDIPEMRELENIDVAFVCMNLPYTMDIYQAASAVLDFEPSIMYPYHHRGQDIEQFKKLIDESGKNIDVRLKDWYPED